MGINYNKFNEYLEYFKKTISILNRELGLGTSVYFHKGFVEIHEGYKYQLASKGQKILNFANWDISQIGSGNIVASVKSAMRMTVGDKPHNLVDYRDKDRFDDYVDADVIGAEKLFYELYCGKDDGLAFNQAIDFLGGRYPVISFLFYLKDPSKYIPVRPNNFLEKFIALGLDTDCLRDCLWENYKELISVLEEIQLFLIDEFKYEDINLLDAHSFVWMSWMLSKDIEELKVIVNRDRINFVFSESEEKYVKIAKLLDYLYETKEYSTALMEDVSDNTVDRLRTEFVKKYSPEQLEKFVGYEIISKFFDISNGSDSLIYSLSLSSDYKIFGSAQHTTNNIYPLYYKKESGWCTKNTEGLSNDRVIDIGRKFRNKFVECMKYASKVTLDTVDDYELFGEYLKEHLGDQGERVWIHKYLHMLFPDKFSEFHSVEWKKYLLCALQIKPRDTFYGMAGQIAQIQHYMKLKDPFIFAHFVYECFPEIDNGGVCRLTFKPGYEKQVESWIAGERVTLTAAEFEGNIRNSRWFYGASETDRSYIFVVETNDGKLLGVATSLSGEPKNGKKFDSRTGIWNPCFAPGSVLPIEKDSDSNSTIKKVDNILYVYKYYYSFYDISAPMLEIYKNEYDIFVQNSIKYDRVRDEFLDKYPAKIGGLNNLTIEDFDVDSKGSFLDYILKGLCLDYGIESFDEQSIGLDDINSNFSKFLDDLCLLIGTDYKDFNKLEANSLNKFLKLKILSIYHPEKYIEVTNEELLDSWLNLLQIHIDNEQSIWVKQSAFLNWKKQYAIFDHRVLSNYSFLRLMYIWSDSYLYSNASVNYAKINQKTIIDGESNRYIEPIDDNDPVAIDNRTYDNEYEDDVKNSSLIDIASDYEYGDVIPKAKELEEDSKNSITPKYKRNPQTAKNALAHAHYKCEIDANHITFVRKNSDKPYTESHHLIPMQYSEQFDYSLDREVNIVSLCSHCHNLIHYGEGAEDHIRKLYRDRAKYLKLAGIDISEENLLQLYGIDLGDFKQGN